MQVVRKQFPIDLPYDLPATFALFSMGSGDPCMKFDGEHRMRLALNTPDGSCAVLVENKLGVANTELYGPGSDWLIPHLPALLGLGFHPPNISEPLRLSRVARNLSGLRIPTLPTLTDRLVQIVLQQLVSFRDACAGWRNLVKRFGTRSAQDSDLWYPPTSHVLSRIASHEFVECGVLPRHGRTIQAVTRIQSKIESIWSAGQPPHSVDETCRLLHHVRGIGPWTVGFLRGAGLGDADAEILGDYSHPNQIAYFFENQQRGDDAQMLRLLEPYRPYRFYVLALILLGTKRPPRHGPRRRSLRERMQTDRRRY